ncbi:MAG: ABC transporter permease [Propionibacteriaceae bacterium]|nr:ABC transporter permease [Propionibacteriaceae bacterium]
MNTWSVSLRGLATVVNLEVMQRLRSKKWLWALIAWAVVLALITSLIMWTVYDSFSYRLSRVTNPVELSDTGAGPMAFSIIVLLLMGLSLVVAPAFTATSINGDRSAGTLATLQATGLSAAEIAGGKLIAAWLTAGAFLVAASPSLGASMFFGNISVWMVLVCLVVIFLLIAVMCAIGLGWSALFNRAAASTVMTYLSIALLSIISPLVMLFTLPFLEEEMEVEVWGVTKEEKRSYERQWDEYWEKTDQGEYMVAPEPPADQCHWMTRERDETRIDKVWWLFVPNPYVVVADAAPVSSSVDMGDIDVLHGLSVMVREMSRPPAKQIDECYELYYTGYTGAPYEVIHNDDGTVTVKKNGVVIDVPQSPVKPRPPAESYPVWPLGLAVNLLLGAGFFVLTVNRLKIPYRALAKGTRIA